MIVIATLVAVAWGSPAMDGSTGLITVPSADTVPSGRISGAFGMMAARDAYDVVFSGIPVGITSGFGRGVEGGAALERDAWSPTGSGTILGASIRAHARYQLVAATPQRVGLAVQAAVDGIQALPAVEGLLIGRVLWRRASVDVAAGPRYGALRDFGVYTGAGLTAITGRGARAMVEQTLVAGSSGVQEWSGRGGARFGLQEWAGRGGARVQIRDRVSGTLWAGGGWFQASPWLGAGAYVGIHSADPFQRDRDGDGLTDWVDLCPYDPEDLDGFEDDDGCVDPDNDGDGIPDLSDPTPDGDLPETEKAFPTPTPRLGIKGPSSPPRPKPAPAPEQGGGDAGE